uniref:Uncharacterized protein n=1 Tax=Nelumbo nucifera TaxID=4432 RepID=A0A822Y3L3_NELNU|nr:TPA_asm: hypothetical protein HUJ06_029983 [Nelumbo nucifera]
MFSKHANLSNDQSKGVVVAIFNIVFQISMD